MDFLPADGRISPANPGKEDPEIVVDFRRRGDRGTRVPDIDFLLNGDGRRNALDLFDVGLSAKRRCPSAKSVSKAREDFPLPEMPVMITKRFRGISSVMSLRLLTFAPLMMMFPSVGIAVL